MQSRFIKNITPSVKLLILIFLICTLIIAKSIFLFIFISILSLIILILLGISVNKCIDFIKKIFLWLLFIVVMYIIIYKNINGLLQFIYKIVLISILVNSLILNLQFDELHSGIYRILSPFKIFGVNINKKSFNIAINITFLNVFLYSSDKIEKIQTHNNKKSYRIKYFIFPRLLTSINYIKNLESSLKLKFYTIRCFKTNLKSVLLLILFIFLFFLAIYKEVIL